MRIIFMGTSSFAVPSLQKLIDSGHELLAVVTQPDRPKGRGKKLLYSPVKEAAILNKLPCYQPERIKSDEAAQKIKGWAPELIVVASYGQIIPPRILSYPRYGCINVHASLLPKYRGAAPIQRALMAGEKVTGITIMYMDEGLDTGDIIKQASMKIDDNINNGRLEKALAILGAELLIETVEGIKTGVKRVKQDHSLATYAHMLKREDELLDWGKDVQSVHNHIRALSPLPGAYSYYGGLKLKIYASRIFDTGSEGVIGQVTGLSAEGFVVQTGKGLIEIREVQKEGKKRMPSSEFLRGHKIKPGVILGR